MIPNKGKRRNTVQRDIVLEEVRKACDHPVAEVIYARIHAVHPAISRSTVYRNLHALVEEGKVREVKIPGKPEHYDRTLPDHYHVVCTQCGRVDDVEVKVPAGREAIGNASGYRILGKEVLYVGLCPDCIKKMAPDGAEE